ncbi:MAG: GMP/IMP nucleotidase [Chromatiales bacterium]|jgi:putative hydrolase of the HAD superfamily|nr:GMP/IMP nucleotidase [Chromatiales bacterium]
MRALDAYDTVLLDMDGTLLDLAYDNYFWLELVPRCMARTRGLPEAEVRPELLERFAAVRGTLEWYCIDYWALELGLDLRALKAASSHRVRYLPGAEEFLRRLQADGRRRVVLVTNAHRYTLEVKRGVAGLDRYLEHFVSSHDYGAPKEHAVFWQRLQAGLDFDPATTLFVDDSPAVLAAAVAHGLAGVIGVTRPDTRQPARPVDDVATVEGLADLLG